MSGIVKFTPHHWPDAASIPPRQFLYGHDYIRGFISATVAPGGAAKTALTISEALSMAAGVDLLRINERGRPAKLRTPQRVCLWNLEDDADEMCRRLAAAEKHYSKLIAKTGYQSRLFMKSAESPIIIAGEVDGGFVLNVEFIGRLIAGLRKTKIDVLIVDPFVSSHSVIENDNDLIDKVVKEGWARIAREANCSIMLVHHTRKSSGAHREMGMDDSRGAGALINAVRAGRVINRLSPEDAPKLGIAPDRAWAYIRVDPGKANLAPPGAATWRRLASVDLDNGTSFEAADGDNVGVVEGFIAPDLAETSEGERAAVFAALGFTGWRMDNRADDWVGVAFAKVLGLDRDKPEEKAAIAAKLKAAIKNGWLDQYKQKIDGKERPMVRVKRKPRSIEDMLH